MLKVNNSYVQANSTSQDPHPNDNQLQTCAKAPKTMNNTSWEISQAKGITRKKRAKKSKIENQ